MGRKDDPCGVSGWTGHWSYGGWMNNAPNFYDVIEEIDHLEDKSKPKLIGHTPDLIDFEKELKPSKGFFSLALSDDDLSSDEESETATKIAQMEKLGTFPFTRPSSIIAPSLSLEFPVAPSSPELEPKEENQFTFLDRGFEMNDNTGESNISSSPTRNCASPELPIPTGFSYGLIMSNLYQICLFST